MNTQPSYPRNLVEDFVHRRKLDSDEIEIIHLRMAEISEQDKDWSVDTVEFALGKQLAKAFFEAYEKMTSGPEKLFEPVPHHSRRGLGTYQMPARTFV